MNKSILVAALLAVALTACGKKEEPAAAAPAPAPAPAAAPAPEAKPAEQAGMAGMARALDHPQGRARLDPERAAIVQEQAGQVRPQPAKHGMMGRL